MYHLENYVNGLVLQWNRIGDDNMRHQALSWSGALMSNDDVARAFAQYSNRIMLDIHFYLVCWDKANKYFDVVSRNSKSNCIEATWKALSPLTERASRARDFFEHLDKQLSDNNFGTTSYGISGSQHFMFGYVDVSNKGKKIERKLTLGRAEVEQVMITYENVLSCLGADLSGGYLQTVGEAKSGS